MQSELTTEELNALQALLAKAHKSLQFLRGFIQIDGLSFGDKHPTIKGNFWWRSQHLPAIYDTLDAVPALIASAARAAELEQALHELVSHCGQCGGHGQFTAYDDVTGKNLWTDCDQCGPLRAFLGEQP